MNSPIGLIWKALFYSEEIQLYQPNVLNWIRYFASNFSSHTRNISPLPFCNVFTNESCFKSTNNQNKFTIKFLQLIFMEWKIIIYTNTIKVQAVAIQKLSRMFQEMFLCWIIKKIWLGNIGEMQHSFWVNVNLSPNHFILSWTKNYR